MHRGFGRTAGLTGTASIPVCRPLREKSSSLFLHTASMSPRPTVRMLRTGSPACLGFLRSTQKRTGRWTGEGLTGLTLDLQKNPIVSRRRQHLTQQAYNRAGIKERPWGRASPPSATCISPVAPDSHKQALYPVSTLSYATEPSIQSHTSDNSQVCRTGLPGEAIGISAAQHPRLSCYGYQTNSFPHMIRARPYSVHFFL